MRPGLGFAKERSSARRAESPVHSVPTVGNALVVARLSGHCKGLAAETSIDRSAAGTEILTVPAPAHACHDRRLSAFPVNCCAKTSSCDRHSALQAASATLIADPTSESTAREKNLRRGSTGCASLRPRPATSDVAAQFVKRYDRVCLSALASTRCPANCRA